MAKQRRVAQLNVGLVARTKQFTKGLRAAGKSLGRFTARVAGVIKRMATMGTVMLSVAGVAGFGIMIRQSLNAVDSMAKLARSLDTSIGFLQRLEYHSALSGVELGKLEGALKRFDRRVSIAAAEGTRAEFLQKMGLQAARLAEMPLEKQLVRFSEALKRNVHPAERTALAYRFFGNEAQKMMLVLDNLPSGLKDARAAIKEMGIGLGREGAARVEQFNDAMFKLQFQVKGLAQHMTIALTPALSAAIKMFQEWLPSGDMVRVGITTAINAAIQGVEDFVNALRRGAAKFLKINSKILDGLQKITKWIEGLHDNIANLFDVMPGYDTLALNAFNAARSVGSMRKEIKEASQSFKDQAKVLEDSKFRLDGFRKEIQRFSEEAKKAAEQGGAGSAARQSLESIQQAIAKQEAMAQKAEQMKERFRTPLQVFRDRIEEINEVWKSGALDVGTYVRAVQDAKKNLLDATGALDTFERKRREGAMETGNVFRSAVFQRAERGAGRTRVDYDREQVRELQAQTGLLQRLVGNTQEGLGVAT